MIHLPNLRRQLGRFFWLRNWVPNTSADSRMRILVKASSMPCDKKSRLVGKVWNEQNLKGDKRKQKNWGHHMRHRTKMVNKQKDEHLVRNSTNTISLTSAQCSQVVKFCFYGLISDLRRFWSCRDIRNHPQIAMYHWKQYNLGIY